MPTAFSPPVHLRQSARQLTDALVELLQFFAIASLAHLPKLSSVTSPVSAFSFSPTPPASSICLFSSSRNDWMAVWSMPSGRQLLLQSLCWWFQVGTRQSALHHLLQRVLTVVASLSSVRLLYRSAKVSCFQLVFYTTLTHVLILSKLVGASRNVLSFATDFLPVIKTSPFNWPASKTLPIAMSFNFLDFSITVCNVLISFSIACRRSSGSLDVFVG